LLDAFIATHKQTLLNVINTAKAVHNLPDEFDTGIKDLTASTHFERGAEFRYKTVVLRVPVDKKKDVSVEIGGRYNQHTSQATVLEAFDLIPEMRKLLKPFGKFVTKRQAAIDARDKAEAEVNKCDI
jgi:hypothetical protein